MTRWFITVEANVRPGNEDSLTGMQRISISSDDLETLLCDTRAKRQEALDCLVTPLIHNVHDSIEDRQATAKTDGTTS